MRYYLDTEFIERPCTIDLISVGIVAEDGRELYRVSSEFDANQANPWVVENVIAKLGDGPRDSRAAIRQHILDFVGNDPKPEFWGYYADYDWVVFCWLFGTMMELPKGWPMYCRDIKQLADSLGNPKLPPNDASEHNALADARWNKAAHDFLDHY